MAVDKHPSRRPAEPYKPPKTSTTTGQPGYVTGEANVTGQEGVHYGFRHELGQHVSHHGTMDHHFHDVGHAIHPNSADKHHANTSHGEAKGRMEGKMGKASRPGDEKGNDEPG